MRDALYVLFRHKIKIVLFFVVASAVIVSYVLLTPPVYESRASLLIKEGRESLNVIPTSDANRALAVSPSLGQDINNEIQILRSPEVYEKLVDAVGLDAILGDDSWMLADLNEDQIAILRDDIVTSLMRNMEIEQVRNTNTIAIMYQAASPGLAHDIVAKMIDIFLDRHIEVHFSEGQYTFYANQAEESQKELKRVEEELAALQNKLNVSSFEEYRTMLLGRIDTLQQDYDMNEAKIAETGSSIQMRQQMLDELPETVETGVMTGNDSSLRELYALQLREQDLLSKYSESSVEVQEIRRQIAAARELLNNEAQVNRGINPITQQIQQELINERATYASLLSRRAELDKLLAEVKVDLNELNTASVEAQQLERERENHLNNYMKYSQGLEEAQIDQIVQRQKLSNIQILQPATFPRQPQRSRKIRNLALGLLVAMLGGVGIAFASEFLDHTMRRQEDIEKWLRLRTLVVIPAHSQDTMLIRHK